jgi:V-type H+-transporting ATPase subunit H
MLRSTSHPFYARRDQRAAILKTSPNELNLEPSKTESLEDFLKSLEDPEDEQAEKFHRQGSPFPSLFSNLLSTRHSPAALNLLCAYIDRLFDIDFVATITALLPNQEAIASRCESLLRTHEAEVLQLSFLTRTVLLLFGAIISEPQSKPSEEKAGRFIGRVLPVLQQKDVALAALGLEGLKRFLRVDQYRNAFVASGGVDVVLSLLAAASKLSQHDTLYHVLFTIWELAYSAEGVGKLSGPEFVSSLAKLLSTVPPEREDLVRLFTAIIDQLNASVVFVENAYDNDILRLYRAYVGKRYVDPELGKQIGGVAETLHQALKHLSLWEKYTREVRSGVLRFTVSHKSELFWKANLERFGENNYRVLQLLKDLLASTDPETVCVACHDLGEFASRSPIGRVKLEEIGAKEAVMTLMSSPVQNIQREALRTTQLLLLRQTNPA